MQISETPLLLRPKRSSFLFERIGMGTMVFTPAALLASIGVWVVIDPVWVMAVWGGWAAFLALIIVDASFAYRKERYEVYGNRVVACSGGIFSERQTDLDFRNVTHVKQRLSWLRYKFFDVGDVMIDSAGSAGDSVTFKSIPDPDGAYAMIRARLKSNGFALTGSELLHRESPSAVGVFVDLARTGLTAAIGVVWVSLAAVGFILGVEGAGEAQGRSALPTLVRLALLFGIPATLLVFNAGMLVVRALDLRRRSYEIYNDVVVYEEGFLDRNNAFIPSENIADADIARTLVDQVFGLADVTVSCQGSGAGIMFRRLKHAGGIKRALDQVVENAHQAKQEKLRAQRARQAAQAQEQAQQQSIAASTAAGHGAERYAEPSAHGPGHTFTGPRPSVFEVPNTPERPAPHLAARSAKVPASPPWTATLRPVPLRAIVAYVPFLFFPLFLVPMGFAWIRARVTEYTVTSNGVGVRTGVANKIERQYAYDKITGVYVRKGPFDGWLNTFSIQICSIGTTLPLDISHVLEADVDMPRLLQQLGISGSRVERRVRVRFSTGQWLRLVMGRLIVGTLIAAVAALLGVVQHPGFFALAALPFVLALLSWLYRRAWCASQSLTLHADHVELSEGLWWRKHVYARYDDVKKAELTRYPFSTHGMLRLFLAGERVGYNNNNQPVSVPYTLECSYVEQIDELRDWLDEVLAGERAAGDTSPPRARAITREVRPALVNSMLPTLFVSLLMLPFMPLLVGWVTLAIRRTRYRLEAGRVVKEHGVLYRRHTSVLLDRVDSTQQKQGALGKMFNNGSVTILTAGSSQPDLVVDNIPQHTEFYRALRA